MIWSASGVMGSRLILLSWRDNLWQPVSTEITEKQRAEQEEIPCSARFIRVQIYFITL